MTNQIDWNVVGEFIGDCGGNEFRVADTSTAAVVYFVSMGIAQSFADVSASRADFVGVKVDGSKAKNPWKMVDREKEASRLGIGDTYDDGDMESRELLADLYFADKAKAKFNRILDGTLVHGGGRGSRIDPVTKTRHEVIEFLIAGNAKYDSAFGKYEALPDNKGVAKAQVRRAFLDKIYEKVADLRAATDNEVERRAASRADGGIDADDLDEILI